MIKAGIIARDIHLQEHLEALESVAGFRITGIHLPPENRIEYQGDFDMDFSTPERLIEKSEAIFFINPVKDDISIIRKTIKNTKDVFLSSPGDHTIREANEIIKLAGEADIALHVARYARYNPSFMQCIPYAGDVRIVNIFRGFLPPMDDKRDTYVGGRIPI